MSHSWEHHGNFTEISVVNRGNAMGISWEYNGNVIRIKERLQNRKLRVKPHRKARRYPLRPLFLEPKLESHEEVKTHPLGWLLSVPLPTKVTTCMLRRMLRTHCGCKARFLRARCCTWDSSETNSFITKVCARFIMDE